MSFSDRLERYFILNRQGEVLLEHPGWVSSISPEGVVMLEGEEEGTASLFHIASGERYELPREHGGQRIWWNPTQAPAGGKCIGFCVRASAPGVPNLNRHVVPRGQCVSHSVVVNLQGELLFEPLPLFLHPWLGQECFAEDRSHRSFRVNEGGERVFAYPREWRYARHLPVEQSPEHYEVVLAPKKYDCFADSDYPRYLAGRDMEWLRGPFESVQELREGMRCVQHAEEEPVFFVDADWNPCLYAPRGCEFDLCGARHGHISYYTSSNSRQGLMGTGGNIIFTPRYAELWHLHGPLWWYKKKGGYGILHESGEELTPPDIGQAFCLAADEALHGLVPARRKSTAARSCGAVNLQGEWVIEPCYSFIHPFRHPEYATALNWKA